MEKIFNLNTQYKNLEARFIKILSKFKDKKKNYKDLYFYYLRPDHIEKKCYFKYFKYINQKFSKRFKNNIKNFQFKVNATKFHSNAKTNIKNIFEQYSFKNQDLII